MDRAEFKKELERHKNQIETSFQYLQKGFDGLSKRNYEFYEFIETNYYDLEERLTRLEKKLEELH